MSTKNIIYMDYQATTPCDKRVLESMLPYFCDDFGNPHSNHVMGSRAHEAVEKARDQIAKLIKANNAREIIFTSGATESNNLAICGVARFYGEKRKKIITDPIEHKCVLEACRAMEREGFEIVMLPVSEKGLIDLNALEKAVDEQTVLVSVMTANNEIGVVQPIDEISGICRRKNVPFHTDAAQAVGKTEVDASKVDLMSISAHKIYGPKGIGALYVGLNPRIKLTPLFFGGGQERGMRSGTLAPALCAGFGKACEIAASEMESERARLTMLKDRFLKKIFAGLDRVYLNGDEKQGIPGCINLSFFGVEGEGIMLGIPDICISSGSACTSESLEPSYVLKAIGARDEVIHSSLRIGLGRFTTAEEVDRAASKIITAVKRLRAMSPVWKEEDCEIFGKSNESLSGSEKYRRTG
ncbi:MAG: aminotransferase class V-fold PLP-dependent enzyme [Holosporaceae bacterium]|jgi:cysteine desulfurase|nr:aminotransferase class V-fold PLP-dependent enzyme [Holosporaceae bacterium]